MLQCSTLLSYSVQVDGIKCVFGLQYLQLMVGFLRHDLVVKWGPSVLGEPSCLPPILLSGWRTLHCGLPLNPSLSMVSSWIDTWSHQGIWRLGIFYFWSNTETSYNLRQPTVALISETLYLTFESLPPPKNTFNPMILITFSSSPSKNKYTNTF